MAIIDFLKKQFIDVIEWTDDSRDTLAWRFPDDDREIKNGAQLIVRESQAAQFVYLGEFGDRFGPGKHSARHRQHPGPHQSQELEVRAREPVQGGRLLRRHAGVHRQQVGHGEPGDDARRGLRRRAAARVRHLRLPHRRRAEVPEGGRRHRPPLPARRVRRHDALAHRERLLRRARHREDPRARRRFPLRRAGAGAAAARQSGARREVRPRDDRVRRRERLGAARGRAGDRQALVDGGGRQPERLRQVPDGAGARPGRQRRRRHGRGARDRHGDGAADDEPARRHRRAGDARRDGARAATAPMGAPELFTPAEVAQQLGVGESDVLASLAAGDLKGRRIGTQWRITRAALDAFLQ